jgi:lipid A 3-O-deacylase
MLSIPRVLRVRTEKILLPIKLFILGTATADAICSDAQELPEIRPAPDSTVSLWDGAGFRQGVHELTLNAGIGIGMSVITSPRAHDWALAMFDFGWMFTSVQAPDKWYCGNWEIIGEVFAGGQFRPSAAYLVGAAPILRYNFTRSHRLVPFIDLGGGVIATDIRDGDLSTTFEFNLQGGAGLHYFFRGNFALTAQYRFIHLSNAGIEFPNLGVNSSTLLLGISWFF